MAWFLTQTIDDIKEKNTAIIDSFIIELLFVKNNKN